jgi:acyl-coenzyme A thioesterase PaaI-like protein
MDNRVAELSPLGRRIERALLTCRVAKLAFPGAFMEIAGRPTGKDSVVVALRDDPVLRDGRGELNICALAALLDAPLGTASDMQTGPRIRPATAHIELQLTGAATQGDVAVEARFVGFSEQSRVRQSLVRADIRAGGNLVGHATGTCVLLDLPPDQPRLPWPWLPEDFSFESLQGLALDAAEAEGLAAGVAADSAATAEQPFIDHFWCGIPQARQGGASHRIPVARHLANRGGHVQGGLLLGMAMRVAHAATPVDMRLSNISAYFISPGLGPVLDVESTVIQQGRSLAVVRTSIRAASGKLVLEASSQHVLA